MDKAEQACADYKKAIECDPENAEAFGQLGSILGNLLHKDRDETVLPYLQRALELQPTKPLSYLRLAWFYGWTGRPKETAAAFRKAAELAPPGSAEAYIYLARAAATVGDHRAVRENLEKALSIDPSNPEAYYVLGEAHGALGDHEQAVTAYTKALESPRVANHVLFRIYLARGSIYDLQDTYAAALSDYDRAIEMCAYQWWVYKRRGRAHFYLKHYEQALADIAKAVELRPDDPSNLTWISPEDVASCPDEKFRTGMVALADKTIQVLESKPDTSEHTKTAAYCARADIYLAAGKLDQANRFVRDLLQRQGKKDASKSAETAGALALLGNILLKQQQYVTAEPVLRECLAIHEQKLPDDPLRYNTLSMLGGALLGQKKYADAEPLLLQGYEGMKQREAKIPVTGKVRLIETTERLVRLYEATNQPDKARTWRENLSSSKRPGS
jgi:tetratricopeptide (TPR) repeat protein